MPGNRKFTRIPPEGTGDRIRVKAHLNIYYEGRTLAITRDDTITLSTSGLTGVIARVREDSITAGMISVNLAETSEDSEQSVITGEVITISGQQVAVVAAIPVEETYSSVTNLVSYDNQYYGQRVSPLGEAYVRFGEGPARVDAAGKFEVQQITVLAQYSFLYNTAPEEFSSILSGSATIEHETPTNCIRTTTTTASGDHALHQSHLYHHYTPGVPIIAELTVAHGDTGKANEVRRWGLFDEDDGLFFELDGTNINFVRRSSTGGPPVETKIAQADWNRDVLDGTGLQETNPSGAQLNLTNINAYWIDYTWHGAGVVRFGIFDNGRRIVCHVESYANSTALSYTSRGSFPIAWEIENTGMTASISEMRTWSASVFAGSQIDVIGDGKTFTHFTGTPITLAGSTETHLVSFRPKTLFNGVKNHCVSSFITINANSWDTVNGDPGIVKIRVYVNAALNTPDWQEASATSSLEKDTTGTLTTPGIQISEFYLRGDRTWDLETITGYWYRSILPLANGVITEYTFTAERMFGANDVAIDMQLRWKEVNG